MRAQLGPGSEACRTSGDNQHKLHPELKPSSEPYLNSEMIVLVKQVKL